MKRVVGLMLALMWLIGWVAPVDYASGGQNPSASAAPGHQTTLGSDKLWRSLGPDERIQSLAIDPSNPNIIYAGSKSGLFKSTDSGATWSNVLVRNTVSLAIDFVNPNNLYAGTASSGFRERVLFKSTDGGASWSNSSSPVDFDFSLLVMDPTSPKTLYASSLGEYIGSGIFILHKSTDGGASWKDSEPDGNISPFGWAINPANPQIFYAPGDVYGGSPNINTGALFKSTDGGTNWSATGLTNTFVSAVAIDPFNPDTLYAGTFDNGQVNTPFRGMLKSADGGNSWFPINNGLSGLAGNVGGIPALAIDPDDSNIIYAGTSSRGVFWSADGGASWSEFNLGLTNLSINALAIDRLGNHLYAATGAGVFEHQYAAPCADPLSPANQSFDPSGGSGFVNVTAASECSWTASSDASWISVTSGSGGNGSGTVSYSVAPNETSTAPRIGIIGIAARFLTVNQAGAPVRINSATVSGKKLFVTGENFDPGAGIMRNGAEQKTMNDPQNPRTALIGKKVGKKIKAGDTLQVRNPNGTISQEFIFTGL